MKIRTARALLGPAALCALAACSGGSGGDAPPTYDELFTEADGLFAAALEEPWTEPSTLPTAGTARYDGVVYMDTQFVDGMRDGAHDLVGDLTMNVDFGRSNGGVSGSISDFVSVDDESWDGTLRLSNGMIDRDALPTWEPVFVADVEGTLQGPGGDAYDVEGELAGAFRGTDYSHAIGGVRGGACEAGGSDNCGFFEGGMAAARR